VRVFSFLLVSFLCLNVCHSYTVVLLSGKQVCGTLLGEDGITVQLRDVSGVVLSIKKSRIDLDATQKANPVEKTAARISKEVISDQQPHEKTLVDIAHEVRAGRNGQARIYTRADLDRVPEISIGEQPEDVGFDDNSAKSESDLKSNESYWRKSAADLRKELVKLRDRRISAQFSCRKALEKRDGSIYGGAKRPSNLNSAFDEPAECERLNAIEAQLEDAEWRWEEFTERARKAEVPWSWIE
jgi:hypothetical protein